MKTPIPIPDQIKELNLLEAYILQFYYAELKSSAPSLISFKIGSLHHLRFLIESSKNEPELLSSLHQSLLQLSRQSFAYKAGKMVDLAQACSKLCEF
jgi:hypothetical protein